MESPVAPMQAKKKVPLPSASTSGCTLSLQVVLLLLVLVVAVVAAAVSFAPLYTASISSAEDSSVKFSRSISNEIVQTVQQYFAKMQQTASTMVVGAALGSWNQTNVAGIVQWLLFGANLGADSINMIFDTKDIWTAGYVLPSGAPAPAGQVVLARYNGTHGFVYTYNQTNTSSLLSFQVIASTTNFRARQYFPIIRAAQGWGDPFIGTSLGISESVLPCGAPIVMPDGSSVGAFYVRTRAAVIGDYFKTLQVASTGRAMLLDVATKRFVASNNPSDPTTVVINKTTLNSLYTDVVDPLIRVTVDALGSTLLTCAMPCSLTVGKGKDMAYVTVVGVNDTYNLNKRLVVMIPSEDFLGSVRQATAVSLGAAGGSIAGLLVLSLFAVLLITRPLTRLEERLYASVTLEDDGDEASSSKSFISDIRNIEEAYEKLQAELQKVKSFLPQSVLKQLEADDEEEDEEENGRDDSEGAMKEVSVSVDTPHSPSHSIAKSTSKRDLSPHRKASVAGSVSRGSESTKSSKNLIQRTLKTDTSVQQRTVTIVMANMNQLHQIAAHGALQRVHSAVMGVLQSSVNECKGVLDSFHGDRFVFMFNASTNCASHATKAAAFMLKVHDVLHGKAIEGFQGLRFGAASGKALCGNIGTDQIKRFSAVGTVVNNAFALMSTCRQFELPNMVSVDAMSGMELEYVCDSVTICVLPHGHSPTLVGTVRAKRETKNDEWMYELQEQEEKKKALAEGGQAALNEALDKIRSGDIHSAEKLLLAVEKTSLPHALLWNHAQVLFTNAKEGKPFPVLPSC